MNTYNQFFKKITGFEPYIFQKQMNDQFQEQNGVILQAPTGSGKTWAAIAPFIYSWHSWKQGEQQIDSYPRKLIYSLPLRTLANSLYKSVKEGLLSSYPELNIKVTLQTGEHSNDPLFEGDIIFTTIDQTLSNVLGIPLSLPRRLANINAGAVVSSFLIFDEVHLLDPQRSFNTVVALLKALKGVTPFCLMTATLSNSFIEKLSCYLSADIVRIVKDDYLNFSFVKNKVKRLVCVYEDELNAEQVLSQHKLKSIVICNTVDRCTNLYKELKNIANSDIEILCIHSRFFQRDRKQKEYLINDLFGKDSPKNAILVSTQVIEVGLDISCDTMHCEISPVNSFLQRIGRCSRWLGEGTVNVYNVTDDNYLPYSKDLSIYTLEVLKKHQAKDIDYDLSQIMIEEVLGRYEESVFESFSDSSSITMNSIRESWMVGGKEKARELIRSINSISVVILPENTETDTLLGFETISLNRYSLKKMLNTKLDGFEGEVPNLVFSLEESNYDFNENKYLVSISPDNVTNYNIVALNSDYIGYSKEYGLDITGTSKEKSNKLPIQPIPTYTIHRDTYQQHINWMLSHLNTEISHPYILRRIQDNHYNEHCLKTLLKYIIVVHDYGKLDEKWQRFANNYQKEKYRRAGKEWTNQLLAHTDYNPNNEIDKEIEKTTDKRPNHAGVGAYLSLRVAPIIFNWSKTQEAKSLWKITISAISRHHDAYAENSTSYKVDEDGVSMIMGLLKKENIDVKREILENKVFCCGRSDNLGSYQVQFYEPIETFTYFIFIRMLRLCDQRSFNYNPLYNKELLNEQTFRD